MAAAVAAVEAAVAAVCSHLRLLLLLMLQSAVLLQTVSASETATSANQNVQQKPLNEAEKKRARIAAEKKAHEDLVKNLLKNPGDIPQLIASKKISPQEVPDPHWDKNACMACHTESYPRASAANLRYRKIETACSNCHNDAIDHSYIHPVDIKPSDAKSRQMKLVMKQQLTKSNGKLNCDTCHEVIHQCRLEDKHRHENPNFFRGGPYAQRADLCLNCHSSEDYRRFNPHEQVDENGKIIESKCFVCHSGDIERLKNAESIDQVDFHLEQGLSALCWGCHNWKPHPGGQFSFFGGGKRTPDHLVKPSGFILKQLEQTTSKKNLLMPLEPITGKVFCATCHNPHAKGVIKNKAAAKGAESKSRLREQEICTNCHTM